MTEYPVVICSKVSAWWIKFYFLYSKTQFFFAFVVLLNLWYPRLRRIRNALGVNLVVKHVTSFSHTALY